MFLCSVKECSCAAVPHENTKTVRDYVTYYHENIPFRSSKRLMVTKCVPCGGVLGLTSDTDAKLLAGDMRTSVASLKEQDTKYRYDGSIVFDMTLIDSMPLPLVQRKQWVRGSITYDYYDETGHHYARQPFLVYAAEGKEVSVGLAQFIRPDNFKSITNVKVWGPDHTQDTSRFS